MMRQYWVFTVVLLITVLGCAGMSLPYPILAPLFMGEEVNEFNRFMGLPPHWLFGISLTVYPLGILIGSSFIGALSDYFGRKKVLTYTLLICILGYLISGFAVANNHFLLFVLARFFTGLCEGNLSIVRAIALDLQGVVEKTRAMSLVSAAVFLGWLVGPLAGGYLVEYGVEVAFLVAAAAIGLCTLLAVFSIEETHQVNHSQPIMDLVKSHNSIHLLKIPAVFKIFMIQLCFNLGLNAFYEFYPVWLVADHDFSAKNIAQVSAIMTVMMTLTSLFVVTRLHKTVGIKAAMLGSLLITAIFMGVLPFTDSVSMWLVFAFSGVGIAIYGGLLPVYASDNLVGVGNGALMGLISMSFFLGNSIIALFGSMVLSYGVIIPLFLGCGLILLAALLLLRHMQNNSEILQAKVST